MKLLNPIRLSVGLAALFVAQAGWAAGTTAGTIVNNTATLDYKVGGVDQSPITSDTSKFVVDRKIDLTVDGAKATDTYPVSPLSPKNNAADTNILKYDLLNAGNGAQNFKITGYHLTNTVNDTFDALLCEIVDVQDAAFDSITPVSGITGVSATYPAAIATGVIINVPVDTTYEVHLACAMPDLGAATVPTTTDGLGDGDLSTIELLAEAVDSSGDRMVESTSDTNTGDIDTTGSVDVATTIDVVLADGAGGAMDQGITPSGGPNNGDRNASHSDIQTFEIKAPELSVVKTSTVISDPFNGTNNPKRIPGAVIEYTITVSNASETSVNDVNISDTIADEDSVVNYISGVTSTSNGFTVSFDDDDDEVTSTINVPAATSSGSGTAAISFQVEIL